MMKKTDVLLIIALIILPFSVMILFEEAKSAHLLNEIHIHQQKNRPQPPIIQKIKPKPPADFQTFILSVQVSTDSRQDANYAKDQINKLCMVLKSVSGIENAIPVKLMGVYKQDNRVFCEEIK